MFNVYLETFRRVFGNKFGRHRHEVAKNFTRMVVNPHILNLVFPEHEANNMMCKCVRLDLILDVQ